MSERNGDKARFRRRRMARIQRRIRMRALRKALEGATPKPAPTAGS